MRGRGNTGARYSDRGRKDAPHQIEAAKAFLANASHLRNTTAVGVAGIFNLADKTAEYLLQVEHGRRERAGGAE